MARAGMILIKDSRCTICQYLYNTTGWFNLTAFDQVVFCWWDKREAGVDLPLSKR